MKGFCECGCGQRTRIAPFTSRQHGWVKGEPIRFIHGHHRWRGTIHDRYTIDPDTGCWNWTGQKNQGYGFLIINGKYTKAHVEMYRQLRGDIPEGLQPDHTCRNRGCINPDHIEPVTVMVNCQRRTTTKLTPEAVREIRESDKSPTELGPIYGVHPAHIRLVRRGKVWRNVE